jgi:crotonobetainyl-CoA:carnitine CoA-transferase CaiB-like acyl-CoA transferase
MLREFRVIDLSTDVAGAFGTKLLALYGADVIKVEGPEGDPTRQLDTDQAGTPDSSVLYAHLNTGKRSVVLDIREAEQRETLRQLLSSADVIVESGQPGEWRQRGIDLVEISGERASRIICSVTPYGQHGPQSQWRATALTAAASGGQMGLCGEPGRPPLKTAGHQAYYQSGLHVFASTLHAMLAAKRSGVGDQIDISLQEAQTAALEGAGPNAMVHGTDAERGGNQMRATWGIYPCADGYVGINAMRRQTAAVYRCIGRPELADDPDFLDILVNPLHNELVQALILEWTASRTSAEIYAASQAHRAPFALIPEPEQLLASEHLQETGFWQEVDHPVLGSHRLPGSPLLIDGERAMPGRAPLLGEHTAEVLEELSQGRQAPPAATTPEPTSPPPLPLHGIQVIDLTQVWAGPYATRFLADMGADVVHIEGPAFPDAVRAVGRSEEERAFDKSAYFNEYNRNKRSLILDIQRPEGLAVLHRLIKRADVLIENWSVGVAERLGLGYDDLTRINPRLVFVQMPAFGKTGPEAERVGFGPTIEQMGGLVALQGYADEEPHKSGISYGDPTGGTLAAGATALALLRRETSGTGSHVVVAQRDNMLGLVGEYFIAASIGRPLAMRCGNRHSDWAPHNVYRTGDDVGRSGTTMPGNPPQDFHETWLSLAVTNDSDWAALRQVVADPRLDDAAYETAAGRKVSEDSIDAVLAEWAQNRNPQDAARALQAAGVPASPVFTPLMLMSDDHLAVKEFFPTIHHPIAGAHRTTHPVWRMARRPIPALQPAPSFGEHNRPVLLERAELSESEIDALAEAGVIANTPTSA